MHSTYDLWNMLVRMTSLNRIYVISKSVKEVFVIEHLCCFQIFFFSCNLIQACQ